MFPTEEYVRSTVQMMQREAERARQVTEARRAAADGRGRSWLWRIEPGMEGAFRSLLGWLLSSQQDAPVVASMAPAPAPAPEPPPTTAEAAPWACPPACCSRAA